MTSLTNTIGPDVPGPALTTAGGDVPDYFALLKPRVMVLVIFTALVGMVVSQGHVQPAIGAISLLAIAVGAGASGCLNMWWDADIDAVMSRTATRPIPSGRITSEEALGFGLFLSVASVVVLGLAANLLAAALLAFTIVFYAVVYSMWLKRATAQNIVIGGAAGALPPVIGQAVVTGSIGIESLILFAIIFIWTPPHFWALALIKADEYARAGIPMMPNVAGPASTRRQIVWYSLLLAPLGLVPVALGFGGLVYAVVGLVGGLGMVAFSIRVLRNPEGDAERRAAMGMFGFSILYLFALFSALLAEQSFGLFRPVLG
ncbi:protoheme IX farnesyltransferase [Methylobacterium radiotolerans]|jgi:protoheme IX farnesyltransferase|uniref:Protoheme IX farnesyltransferase n=1 Tax=Methylobacterium radiotolerans (strain ATCC 27329 / DSM 1819 / JCM 2831 / NBRC 15690 / NCIMB 10815 / 0-1) TaxID=426355 RepID=COXX_METRJ|nr:MULTISPECIES: heme o synthase [Methylobacterium]B1M595.1 RecName: Full=Protoheme IX farnesyltransferase; AltName: Full=Heme B farnesyltransferase; AltName: Full=Heme O synthase [Methylobacterium radiotolerans JCM 2831]ACB22058.1 protoheme IX farnesyltransferase [Methylobacterium radiotolerans JCM 2831]KIU37460.1 protoheme IX farnesyltransferase [Methylobacterium radiotolerans]KTS11762.1 protoheme IX farnesyltransferase [Methylobacterium radiotolerans]KTS41580.1 protoheme IX farnesyltransfer